MYSSSILFNPSPCAIPNRLYSVTGEPEGREKRKEPWFQLCIIVGVENLQLTKQTQPVPRHNYVAIRN